MKYIGKRLKGSALSCFLILFITINALAVSVQGGNVVFVSDSITAPLDSNVTVSIRIIDATGVAAVGIKLSYNASVVNVTDATAGSFVQKINDFFAFDGRNSTNGWVTINTFITGIDLVGNLTIANVTFKAVGQRGDISSLNLTVLALSNQSGRYLPFSIDNGTFTIINRQPVLNTIGDKTVNEGLPLVFTIGATDPDGDTLTYSASNLPSGAVFDTATHNFSWTPSFDRSGTYPDVQFTVTDGTLADSENITITVNDVPQPSIPPAPTGLVNTSGNFWINYSWQAGAGNITNSYNVSLNGTWTNGSSQTYRNTTVGPHGTAAIIVYAYNNSAGGSLSLTRVTDSKTIPNNPAFITNTSNAIVNEGSTISVDYDRTDADGDTATFSTNRTDLFTGFNTATGQGVWVTDFNDAGTYYVNFGVSDGYGSVNNYTMTITVNDVPQPFIPPAPTGLVNTSGNFWINYSWQAGAGNITNSYNVSLNGTWTNGSSQASMNSTLGPHGTSTIIVYAYNNSAGGSLSLTRVTDSKTIPNNPVFITNTSNANVNEGSTISVDYDRTDADGDTATFSTNRTDLFTGFNTVTGQGAWVTDFNDAGTYYVNFGVSDGFGSVSNYTMTITVNDVNNPPSISGLVNQSGNINTVWTYDISSHISDPEGDILTVTTNDNNISVTGFVLRFNYSVVITNKPVIVSVSDGQLSSSQTIFVSTLENTLPMLTDPSSSQLIPDDTDGTPMWGEISTLNITATDTSGIASVIINLSAIGRSPVQPMVNIGSNIWSVTTNASAGTSPQIYQMSVNATDIYGNSNNSVSIPVVVMRNGDVDGNNLVDIVDAMLLANNVSYPGRYSISSAFVADVTGDGDVNIVDAMIVANYVSFPEQGYILH